MLSARSHSCPNSPASACRQGHFLTSLGLLAGRSNISAHGGQSPLIMTGMLDEAELRSLLHELRGPLGAFAMYVALLDAEEMSTAAQAHLKTMHGNMERMTAALNAIDFAMENGASRVSSRR